MSEKTKKQYTKEIEEATTLVLGAIASSQEKPLWKLVIEYHMSKESPKMLLRLMLG